MAFIRVRSHSLAQSCSVPGLGLVGRTALACLLVAACQQYATSQSCDGSSDNNCSSPTVCVFDGADVTALGAAELSIATGGADDVLSVSNIGSSGQDGVRSVFDSTSRVSQRFVTPNFSAPGEAHWDSASLRSGIAPPQGVGAGFGASVALDEGGEFLHVIPAFDNPAPQRSVIVFQGGMAVANLPVADGAGVWLPQVDVEELRYSEGRVCLGPTNFGEVCDTIDDDCDALTCNPATAIGVRLARVVPVTLDGVGEAASGDRLLFVSFRERPASSGFDSNELRVSGMPRVGIVAEGTPLNVDCNDNGIEDACEIRQDPRLDCDLSGALDACEIAADGSLDCDGDGRLDSCQIAANPGIDCDDNGRIDACELAADPSLDCNGDGTLDRCQVAPDPALDCDGDGRLDSCQIAADPSLDCNGDGEIDSCQIDPDPALDCDGDGRIDSCQIAANPGLDCDANGQVDSCQIAANPGLDCDGDGRLDSCQIDANSSLDCDGDGRLDSCQIAGGAADCNSNGALDSCDIASGASLDEDGDGVPDECDPGNDDVGLLYRQTLASARSLREQGYVPQETIDYLVDNEETLSTDLNALAASVFVVEFTSTPPAGDGGLAAGGVVNGPISFALSSGGLFVGTMRVAVSWNNNSDDCLGAIGGHTFVGGVINGGCNSTQIGPLFNEDCLPTKDCPDMQVECGTYQNACLQSLGSLSAMFNTPLSTICSRCPEFPTQLPGDCNNDAQIDISDASCLFGHLFLGSPVELTCGDGTIFDEANLALLDWNGDESIDLSDGIGTLLWLFSGSPSAAPHVLGNDCVLIPTCTQTCGF